MDAGGVMEGSLRGVGGPLTQCPSETQEQVAARQRLRAREGTGGSPRSQETSGGRGHSRWEAGSQKEAQP